MAKKRLNIEDAQGVSVDYDIAASNVTVGNTPLDVVLEGINGSITTINNTLDDMSAGDSISYNNIDTLVIE